MNPGATKRRHLWPYDAAMAGRRPSSKTEPVVGKRLAIARQRKGITQADLAERLGVSQSLVAHYETRATNPQLGFLERAAVELGTTVAELIGEEESPAPKKPGPRSQLDLAVEKLKELPRTEQQRIVEMLDDAIERAQRRVGA
jgi:transcriptional regulator with XRE-family HTH domain